MNYKLSELCEYVKGKVNVEALNSANYVSTENMLPNKEGIVQATTLPSLGQTQIFKSGDVLVSNIRPYFRKIWYAQFDGGCSNDVLVFRAKEGVNDRFLYYVLANDSFFDYSMATSKGTKMPRGDKSSLMKYEIRDVAYKNQDKIAEILEVLDQKIQVNKQINDNLQQQALSIFQEWFIDNPDKTNWHQGTFSELVQSTLNGDWGKESPSGNNIQKVYCIRGADIPDVRAGSKGKMPIRYILPKNYASKMLTDGDIVIEISGGSPTQSTGRCVAVTQSLLERYDSGMVCTNFCKAIKPKSNYSMFIYYYWQYLYDKKVFFAYENGTTGIKNLDFSGFLDTETIIIPPEELVSKFNNYCKAVFDQVFANGKESEKLAEIRDYLLPRLMSGELDVSNIVL